MHACEPVPVLAEPGVVVGGHLRQQAEGGAAVGRDLRQLCDALRPRLLPKERESQLVTSIEKRDALLALARTIRNPSHLLGVATVMRGDRLAPSRRLGECRVLANPRRIEAPIVCRA